VATNLGSVFGGLTQYTSMGTGTTMATAGYTPAQTWIGWNQYYVTGSTTEISQTWVSWNNGVTSVNQLYPQQPVDDAQSRIAAEEAERKRVAARQRAEEFLLENLSPTQRESYKKTGMFVVETPKKNRYAVHKAQNVRKLEGDRAVVSYCIHTYGVPREDELLGFKLLLEANEEEFLKTANATRLAA
jgi:hypothetical protein